MENLDDLQNQLFGLQRNLDHLRDSVVRQNAIIAECTAFFLDSKARMQATAEVTHRKEVALEIAERNKEILTTSIKGGERRERGLFRQIEYERAVKAGPWC